MTRNHSILEYTPSQGTLHFKILNTGFQYIKEGGEIPLKKTFLKII